MRCAPYIALLVILLIGSIQAEPKLWGPVNVPLTVDTAWYVQPQIRYANYVTNPALLAANKISPQQASQYLYDRPRALIQLYLLTGDEKWRTHAIDASQFYINHIGADGYFTLVKKKDVKYLMPKGLQLYYQLTGDETAKNAIMRIYNASLDWSPNYHNQGFWTERNQAAALDAAVSLFEMNQDARARQRIEQILAATVDMVDTPRNNWPNRGCPQHTFSSHEGGADGSAVCSPWMLALLADPIWRYQQLTGSAVATKLLQQFGEFILTEGTYPGNGKFAGQRLPKYLVVFDNRQMEDINPWNDVQHSCDVSALLAKALYVSESISVQGRDVFQALIKPCKSKQNRLNDNKLYWRARPERKFGWEYSTTSDLPWLEQAIVLRMPQK
jgi:hypothetical protein